ncbi:MAG: hypothetical protein UR79_C0004G0040 [Candidatus Campbellbacteria bacterium GW2011_GWD1_35_49]|jgi:hypothetical protein|nr:MAG: hypothetical protein UR58_C0001G0008 [Candidatus Campbellbacteria bacterium GW2011_OD1_34_28]KKP74551.1 MAG: hypothetical protein UR74_C0004G0040 [Candidatus Campbellbacteria bacterium GW2011_GWD2_35_24]KKP76550.1 MAG: hypothetical protein UR76_C0004G0040 [Candidatus Campbellbacteria bacterium GW2011_GWC1_35_31]KKP78589.1 MAG: hypothetical protein UR79_C0004G0040 [Candidatus Campbellbacteria bacterium GW2011_GWD1_35_49]HAP74448.1 hypothetical protein [Candidatus Campbellbacteria bacteri
MKKEALDLLERSFLFPSEENDRYSVGLKIHRMGFPFISRQIFFEHINSDKLQNFERYIYYFILKYIKTWVSKNSDTIERKNEDIFQYLFDFRKDFNHEDVFSKICEGDDKVGVEVKINNSNISIKRFGNCLGFKIGHGNDVHETGFLALEEMTNERDSLIKPFIHRIECSIPLPKEHAEENSSNISFIKIHKMLREALPYVDWASIDSWIHEIILQYKEVSWNYPTPEDGVFVGMCANIPIKAMLVHTGCYDFQKTKPWRNGNVSLVHETSLTYNFCEADDLRLVLMAHCGNRRYASFTKHDIRLDTEDVQRRLLLVGAMLYTQLCTMFSVYNATHDQVLA